MARLLIESMASFKDDSRIIIMLGRLGVVCEGDEVKKAVASLSDTVQSQ
jgi:hypothetical protein